MGGSGIYSPFVHYAKREVVAVFIVLALGKNIITNSCNLRYIYLQMLLLQCKLHPIDN